MILKIRRLITIQGGLMQCEAHASWSAPEHSSYVRRYRLARGLSQQDFAHEIEMDRTYYGGVERGERNVSIDNIERIATGLGVSPHLLLLAPD